MSKLDDLNRDIMNIQGRSLEEIKQGLEKTLIKVSYPYPANKNGTVNIDTSDVARVAYALGLRDARHAACDLVLNAFPEIIVEKVREISTQGSEVHFNSLKVDKS